MESIHAWRDFYMMAGGAIAALTGLLFVAMSIHLEDILTRPGLTRDVSIALYGMLYQLLFCGFMLTPGVTLRLAGVVVIGSGLIWAFAYVRFSRGKRFDTVVNSGVGLISSATGVPLLLGQAWGLYLYGLVLALGVVALVRLCWMLLTMALSDLRELRPRTAAVAGRPGRVSSR